MTSYFANSGLVLYVFSYHSDKRIVGVQCVYLKVIMTVLEIRIFMCKYIYNHIHTTSAKSIGMNLSSLEARTESILRWSSGTSFPIMVMISSFTGLCISISQLSSQCKPIIMIIVNAALENRNLAYLQHIYHCRSDLRTCLISKSVHVYHDNPFDDRATIEIYSIRQSTHESSEAIQELTVLLRQPLEKFVDNVLQSSMQPRLDSRSRIRVSVCENEGLSSNYSEPCLVPNYAQKQSVLRHGERGQLLLLHFGLCCSASMQLQRRTKFQSAHELVLWVEGHAF